MPNNLSCEYTISNLCIWGFKSTQNIDENRTNLYCYAPETNICMSAHIDFLAISVKEARAICIGVAFQRLGSWKWCEKHWHCLISILNPQHCLCNSKHFLTVQGARRLTKKFQLQMQYNCGNDRKDECHELEYNFENSCRSQVIIISRNKESSLYHSSLLLIYGILILLEED